MKIGFKDFTKFPILNKIDEIIENLWEKCNLSYNFSIDEFIMKTGGKITHKHPIRNNNYSKFKAFLGVENYSYKPKVELLFSSRNSPDGKYTIFIRKDIVPNEYICEILKELALEFISKNGIDVFKDYINKDFYILYFSLGMQYPRKKLLSDAEAFCASYFKTTSETPAIFESYGMIESLLVPFFSKSGIKMEEFYAQKWLKIVYDTENFKHWNNQKTQEDFDTMEDIIQAIKSRKNYRSIKEIVHDLGGHFKSNDYIHYKVTFEKEENGKFCIGIPCGENLDFSLDEPRNYIILGLLLNIFYDGDVTEKEKDVFGKGLMNCFFEKE